MRATFFKGRIYNVDLPSIMEIFIPVCVYVCGCVYTVKLGLGYYFILSPFFINTLLYIYFP